VIQVLVTDDSALFRNAFVAFLETDPELHVVATAKNGHEAVELVQRHRPDVVTMDVNMPVMNGYEAVEQIMARCPTPVVMVTGSPSKQEKQSVIKALALGAVEVEAKPDLTQPGDAEPLRNLIERIKRCSTAHVVRHIGGLRKRAQYPAAPVETRQSAAVVAIACSTGGPAALAEILPALPSDLGAAVLVVQHITEGFTRTLVEWLQSLTPLHVREGERGMPLAPGTVIIAPPGRHMRVDSSGKLHLLDLPPIHGCKPSGDVLLTSVAETFGDRAVGVILTGMGSDGTDGLLSIRNRGGVTIAQDEASCAIFGMPKSAIEAGAVDRIVPLAEIPAEIVRLVGRQKQSAETPRAGS